MSEPPGSDRQETYIRTFIAYYQQRILYNEELLSREPSVSIDWREHIMQEDQELSLAIDDLVAQLRPPPTTAAAADIGVPEGAPLPGLPAPPRPCASWLSRLLPSCMTR